MNHQAVITLVLADDHEVVRRGLRMTIAAEEGMVLLGEAATGRDAVRLVQELEPTLVLLDVQMPDLDGVAAAQAICQQHPTTGVIMLTNFAEDAQLYAALDVGVIGYLLKDISGDDLVAAIRGAARGEPQLHPSIALRLMRRRGAKHEPLADLTERERDVLKAVARGLSNKEIAQTLVLTETTVKGYVSTVLGKLGVSDRTQAALIAVRHGLVRMDELPDIS
ncbi:MAG: response regulator transcription factor [Caldilineaceae bacterium]